MAKILNKKSCLMNLTEMAEFLVRKSMVKVALKGRGALHSLDFLS
jgi:hypothetical protein